MNRLVRLLLRNGWRRGVLGGSRPWLVAGGAALVVRVLQKLIASEDKVVYSEELQPGETVVIGHARAT
jgi:hypothetical protein